MKKILLSLLFLTPLLALGSTDLFQTSDDPAGKYRCVESDNGMYGLEYCQYNYTDHYHTKKCVVWRDNPDHYIFGTKDEADALTQLLAIMSENWNISDVVISFHYSDDWGHPRYHFVSLYCSDLGIKMNNDEHFFNCPITDVYDYDTRAKWKYEYEKSFKIPCNY